MKGDILNMWTWKEGQAFIPFLKLHLYFTEVTEDSLLYFNFLFPVTRVFHDSFLCVGVFSRSVHTCMLMVTLGL